MWLHATIIISHRARLQWQPIPPPTHTHQTENLANEFVRRHYHEKQKRAQIRHSSTESRRIPDNVMTLGKRGVQSQGSDIMV